MKPIEIEELINRVDELERKISDSWFGRFKESIRKEIGEDIKKIREEIEGLKKEVEELTSDQSMKARGVSLDLQDHFDVQIDEHDFSESEKLGKRLAAQLNFSKKAFGQDKGEE